MTNNQLTDLRTLILSEVGNFFAGVGSPGEPETSEEMQRELSMRLGRILNNHIVNYPRCEALVEILRECRIARDEAQAELQERRKADSEPVAWEFWPEDDYEQMFLVQGTDDPASETVDHAGKKWISSPLFRGNNTSAIKENQLRIQGIEALEKFLTASPTECSMSAGVLLALECSRILKVIIKNNGWGDFTGGKFEEGTSETIISDLREHHPKTCHAAMIQSGNSPAQNTGWIPVNERMPVEFEAVIAFDGEQVYGEAMYSSDDGFTIDGYEPCDRVQLQSVTHWMPLPAAPQKLL